MLKLRSFVRGLELLSVKLSICAMPGDALCPSAVAFSSQNKLVLTLRVYNYSNRHCAIALAPKMAHCPEACRAMRHFVSLSVAVMSDLDAGSPQT